MRLLDSGQVRAGGADCTGVAWLLVGAALADARGIVTTGELAAGHGAGRLPGSEVGAFDVAHAIAGSEHTIAQIRPVKFTIVRHW
jgi:hypothetical protein